MRYKATVDIYIEMGDRWTDDPDGALADGISAMFDSLEFEEDWRLADWSYHPDARGDYRAGYAKPFNGLTPTEELAE